VRMVARPARPMGPRPLCSIPPKTAIGGEFFALMRDEGFVHRGNARPHLAYWPRSSLPSADDQGHTARGILRHDKGRRMPHPALAAPLATTLALGSARESIGVWLAIAMAHPTGTASTNSARWLAWSIRRGSAIARSHCPRQAFLATPSMVTPREPSFDPYQSP